jgi:hypothetical protein
MTGKRYFILSGVLFGLIALVHLLRLVYQTPAQLGSWPVPFWLSWLALIVPGFLCVWGLRLGAKR